MNTPEPHGPWIEPMIRAKAVDPRTGIPSWNRLATLAGVGTSTITNMVAGRTRTSPGTIAKVAAALNVTPEQVSKWVGTHRPVRHTYTPTPEAARLTEAERKALDQLITVMVRGRDEQDGTPTNAEVIDLPTGVAARKRRHPSPEEQ